MQGGGLPLEKYCDYLTSLHSIPTLLYSTSCVLTEMYMFEPESDLKPEETETQQQRLQQSVGI